MDELKSPHRHRWPLFVLAGVLLGVLLAFIWMRHEVERTRRSTPSVTPSQEVPAESSPSTAHGP